MRISSIALLVTLLGCSAATLTTEQGLARDAASEWKCEESDIQVKKIDRSRFHVSGCRHDADYACSIGVTATGGSRCEIVSGR
jgi:hypothetical protein